MFNIDEFMQKYCKPEITQDYLDLAYGANRTLNGLSWGGLDYLGRRTGFDAPMTEYLNLLPAEEREKRERLGDMVQLAGAGLSTGTFLRSIPTIGANIVRWNGRRDLIEQLNRGLNFKDITYGYLDRNKVLEINNIRKQNDMPLMLNRRINIPANVVKKWHHKRLENDNMTPVELSNSLDNVLFNPDTVVTHTKYPQNQALINHLNDLTELGFVSVNPGNLSQNVVKSIYRVKPYDVDRVLFGKSVGRNAPSPHR